jgi:hypothetical protein
MSSREWIISELRRILAEAERAPAPFSPAGGGRAPAPSSPPAGGDWVEHECKYWGIKPTASGGSFGSFGVMLDGEKGYFRCFDEKLLVKYDPSRGSRWLLKLAPWKDTMKILDMRPADESGDDIPF